MDPFIYQRHRMMNYDSKLCQTYNYDEKCMPNCTLTPSYSGSLIHTTQDSNSDFNNNDDYDINFLTRERTMEIAAPGGSTMTMPNTNMQPGSSSTPGTTSRSGSNIMNGTIAPRPSSPQGSTMMTAPSPTAPTIMPQTPMPRNNMMTSPNTTGPNMMPQTFMPRNNTMTSPNTTSPNMMPQTSMPRNNMMTSPSTTSPNMMPQTSMPRNNTMTSPNTTGPNMMPQTSMPRNNMMTSPSTTSPNMMPQTSMPRNNSMTSPSTTSPNMMPLTPMPRNNSMTSPSTTPRPRLDNQTITSTPPSSPLRSFTSLEECELAYDRDLNYIKQLYSAVLKVLLAEIENEFDLVDYDDSFIFDEFPDRETLLRMADTIIERIGNMNLEQGALETTQFRSGDSDRRHDPLFRNLIESLIFQELLNRRRHNRRRRERHDRRDRRRSRY